MTIGVGVETADLAIEEVLERARLADQMSCHSLWTHQYPQGEDSIVLHSALASVTDNVGLCTGIVPIYGTHPLTAARQAGTLDLLSGGRFSLGVGLTHPFMVEWQQGLSVGRPLTAMREYIEILRRVFVDGDVSVAGETFTARLKLDKPVGPNIRILGAALRPRMIELVAQHCDGVNLWMSTAQYLREHVMPSVEKGLAAAGKRREDFEVSAYLLASVTDDADEILEISRQSLTEYTLFPYYRRLFELAGFEEEMKTNRPSLDMARQLHAVGDRDHVRSVTEEYRQAGADLVIVAPSFDSHYDRELFIETLAAAQDASTS